MLVIGDEAIENCLISSNIIRQPIQPDMSDVHDHEIMPGSDVFYFNLFQYWSQVQKGGLIKYTDYRFS